MSNTYLDCRRLIEANDLVGSIPMDIAYCVSSSLDGYCHLVEISDDEFEAICGYVRLIWDHCSNAYTQSMSDIVVDCVHHCFCFNETNGINLTLDDLIHGNKLREVLRAFTDHYWECC